MENDSEITEPAILVENPDIFVHDSVENTEGHVKQADGISRPTIPKTDVLLNKSIASFSS